MAGASLLVLIDDIASVLDDVAVLTKVAAKKTSGILGDDLALNAEQVTGVNADRELPVVWAVAKGSLVNKVILVPSALAVSTWVPVAISPLLMIGGAYLSIEGFEKVFEKIFPSHSPPGVTTPTTRSETEKIKGAIRTDFILSAEIVVITLGSVATEAPMKQLIVLSTIAVLMTVGVYGLVAGIVKLDDLGLYLLRRPKQNWVNQKVGRGILLGAPYLMRFLGVAGTAAMFLVGGGILVHGLPKAWLEGILPSGGLGMVLDGVAGLLAGAVLFLVVKAVARVRDYFRCQ